jgi:hypothetical protein
MFSRFIHFVTYMKSSFLYDCITFHAMYTPHCFTICLMMNTWIVSSFADVNSVVINMHVQTRLQPSLAVLLIYTVPMGETAGSHCTSMFNIIKNCQTVFHSGCDKHFNFSAFLPTLIFLFIYSFTFYFISFLWYWGLNSGPTP